MIGEIAGRVEAILARPYPAVKDVERHCAEACEAGYRSVILPSSLVAEARAVDEGAALKTACLIGFPFGNSDRDAKRYETELAVDAGAHEIELIPTLARFLERDHSYVLREIRDVVDAADERPVSVVIEVHLWDEEQLSGIVQTILDSGAQFISTSAGSLGRPATVKDIENLRELAGPDFGIKAAGLRDLEAAEDLIEAGADRLVLLSASMHSQRLGA